MKKTLFILIVLVLSLLYYLGFLTRDETLPFSKEFFSVETAASEDAVLDFKRRILKGRDAQAPLFSLSAGDLDNLHQLKLDRGMRNLPLVSAFLVARLSQGCSRNTAERRHEE